MFKVFAFLTKKQDLDLQAFINHYENDHVPLIGRLAPPPLVYKRNYLVRGGHAAHRASPPHIELDARLPDGPR